MACIWNCTHPCCGSPFPTDCCPVGNYELWHGLPGPMTGATVTLLPARTSSSTGQSWNRCHSYWLISRRLRCMLSRPVAAWCATSPATPLPVSQPTRLKTLVPGANCCASGQPFTRNSTGCHASSRLLSQAPAMTGLPSDFTISDCRSSMRLGRTLFFASGLAEALGVPPSWARSFTKDYPARNCSTTSKPFCASTTLRVGATISIRRGSRFWSTLWGLMSSKQRLIANGH